MNGQQIMDALAYLDDDLIEATGRQRNKKPRRNWLLPAVMAACLCIAIFGITDQSKSAPESEALRNEYSSISDGLYGAPMEESPMESAGGTEATFTAVLRVTQVTDTGFAGHTADEEDSGDLKSERIIISCNSDIAASLQVGDLVRIRYKKGQESTLIDIIIIQE